MPTYLIPALITGILSAAIFLLVVIAGLGFFFLFLPTLPLFYIGLGKDPKIALASGLVAATAITLLGGPALAILYLFGLALPAWHIARQGMRSRLDAQGQRHWFPIGMMVLQLTLCACVLIALVTGFYATQPENILQILSHEIHDAFSDLQDDYSEIIDLFADQWSFLVFSISIWMWGMALYAHGWIAERMLQRKHLALRPDFAVRVFYMPSWMLTLMLICGLASLIGSPNMRFLGNATFIALLLPYFFLGAALIHAYVKTWPNHRFFLFFMYFIVFAQFWPALILSGIGVWHHIKRLSGSMSSSRS